MASNETDTMEGYLFPMEPIPRLCHNDPVADELIAHHKPVVLTDSGLAASALHWDACYLREHIGNGEMNVFASDDSNFMYFDDTKFEDKKTSQIKTKRLSMSFNEFHEKLQTHRPGQPRLYLQQQLTDTVGERIMADFLQFNWQWLLSQKERNHWGGITSNLLLVGMEGNVTPAHFDEQENFFAQLQGWKRCLLFSPDQFECLYPHPLHHPHDRQSQVDIRNPDYVRFPKFRNAHAMEAIVKPGDVLHIPVYWWHHIESLQGHGTTVSVNFWFKGENTHSVKVEYPLSPQQKVAMMRNVEKMLGEALQDKEEIGPFLRTLVEGRYT